jgi:hypothetical protein
MTDSESITSYVAIAISILTALVGAINHKRVRSVCCNRKLEVSLDIETTTPPNKLDLKLPTHDTADKSSTSAVA